MQDLITIEPVTDQITLETADDYRLLWDKLSPEKKAEATAKAIIRERIHFNMPLFGEGESYQGTINLSNRIKHITQPDGYDSSNIAKTPELSLGLEPDEVHAVIIWALTGVPPVGFENGLKRIQLTLVAILGVLPTPLPPAKRPAPVEAKPEIEPVIDPQTPTEPPMEPEP